MDWESLRKRGSTGTTRGSAEGIRHDAGSGRRGDIHYAVNGELSIGKGGVDEPGEELKIGMTGRVRQYSRWCRTVMGADLITLGS
jgi:hypothetical protein